MIAKNASDTLIDILDNHAKTHPDKLAYIFLTENGKTALTNYELWTKVTALASCLLVMVKYRLNSSRGKRLIQTVGMLV